MLMLLLTVCKVSSALFNIDSIDSRCKNALRDWIFLWNVFSNNPLPRWRLRCLDISPCECVSTSTCCNNCSHIVNKLDEYEIRSLRISAFRLRNVSTNIWSSSECRSWSIDHCWVKSATVNRINKKIYIFSQFCSLFLSLSFFSRHKINSSLVSSTWLEFTRIFPSLFPSPNIIYSTLSMLQLK